MKIEQLYTGCLAEAAYYIESEGEVAIIDPLRETDPYIKMAEDNGARIKYIFETHFHADFVSGHVDLAKKTGATIVFGPMAETTYKAHVATDGEEFKIGKVRIKVLHTPGHTMESSTYLLLDEQGKAHSIFSGDTLFIGDVGRPDLAVKSDLTQEDLAGLLFESLRNKIMTLPDEVIVYPAHGAGSACGKNMSKETFDTLGNQKRVNYALRADMSKEAFVKELTSGIMPAPQYFSKNAMLNKGGYDSVDEVMERGLRALKPSEVAQEIEAGALVLDVRKPQEFAAGHLPNAMFIGIDGTFAVWVGTLIKDLNQRIVLVTPEGREEETVLRLARVGYDNAVGYLAGGVAAWQNAGLALETVTSIAATEFKSRYDAQAVHVLDVRKPGEHISEHVIGAESYPLDFINSHLHDLDKSKTYHVHCAGGYRSMIAISILKAHGYTQLIDIAGGFKAISEAGVEKSAYVCPSTIAS